MPGAGTGSVGQQEQLSVEPGEPHPRMPLNFGTGVQEVVGARGKSVRQVSGLDLGEKGGALATALAIRAYIYTQACTHTHTGTLAVLPPAQTRTPPTGASPTQQERVSSGRAVQERPVSSRGQAWLTHPCIFPSPSLY